MSTTTKLEPVDVSKEIQEDVVKILERYLAKARNGEIISLGIVVDMRGGGYATTFSKCMDVRTSGAMLIELGLRRIGFETSRGED